MTTSVTLTSVTLTSVTLTSVTLCKNKDERSWNEHLDRRTGPWPIDRDEFTGLFSEGGHDFLNTGIINYQGQGTVRKISQDDSKTFPSFLQGVVVLANVQWKVAMKVSQSRRYIFLKTFDLPSGYC